MSLIEKLKADYESRRTEVEVLGERVFVTPLSVGEQSTIATLHPDDAGLRIAETLVRKCVDAEGNPVFTREDKMVLKAKVAGDRLGPILAAINGPSVADQAKNSEATD